MSTRPVIFISAVSKELRSARDLVAKTLVALGYEPKWQDIAATDAGDLRGVLRKWVDESEAVIQLVGHCYGFAPKDPDAEFGVCSYTQLEALYARQQGKKVWYVILSPEHPTDPCAAEASAPRELQDAYRVKVTGTSYLYHRSSSQLQTDNIVLRLRNDLAELRKRGQLHAAIVVGILLVLVLGIGWLKRDLFVQHQASTATIQKVDVLHEDNARLAQQNDKLLQALRDLPQALSRQPRGDAPDDEDTRTARAYTVLEAQLKLTPGSLAKELPQFAQQLLQRADTSALDRANALFATRKFAEAEAEALKNNWAVTIAIVDEGGHLLWLQRLDGAPAISAHIAPAKAHTAALGRRESKVYEDVINGGRTSFLSAPVIAGMLEGGVPVLKDGQCLGAVGVSGVKSSEDAQVARAGIAALGL